MNLRLLLLPFAAVFLLSSCKPMLTIPNDEDAVRAANKGIDISTGQLQQSRQLYINKCGSCHTLYLPNKYKGPMWEQVLNEMSQRAKLTEDEKKDLLTYLIIMSEKPKSK